MIIEPTPKPKPTISLPKINICTIYDIAITRGPIVNKLLEVRITGFLPILSERGPATRAPIKAPSNAKETMSSFCGMVISGHVWSKYNYAPAIMPVLYPNKYPVIEPIKVR